MHDNREAEFRYDDLHAKMCTSVKEKKILDSHKISLLKDTVLVQYRMFYYCYFIPLPIAKWTVHSFFKCEKLNNQLGSFFSIWWQCYLTSLWLHLPNPIRSVRKGMWRVLSIKEHCLTEPRAVFSAAVTTFCNIIPPWG